jgi:hypothetical protein
MTTVCECKVLFMKIYDGSSSELLILKAWYAGYSRHSRSRSLILLIININIPSPRRAGRRIGSWSHIHDMHLVWRGQYHLSHHINNAIICDRYLRSSCRIWLRVTYLKGLVRLPLSPITLLLVIPFKRSHLLNLTNKLFNIAALTRHLTYKFF